MKRLEGALTKCCVLMACWLGCATPAFADTLLFGAVTRCDAKAGVFEVGAVVRFNEQVALYASQLAGTRELAPGEHKLACRLGPVRVAATVRQWEPSSGECRGAGYTTLGRVAINGRPEPVLWDEKPFNFRCLNEKMLVSLTVRRLAYDGRLQVTRCEASDWTWERGYVDVVCMNEQRL